MKPLLSLLAACLLTAAACYASAPWAVDGTRRLLAADVSVFARLDDESRCYLKLARRYTRLRCYGPATATVGAP